MMCLCCHCRRRCHRHNVGYHWPILVKTRPCIVRAHRHHRTIPRLRRHMSTIRFCHPPHRGRLPLPHDKTVLHRHHARRHHRSRPCHWLHTMRNPHRPHYMHQIQTRLGMLSRGIAPCHQQRRRPTATYQCINIFTPCAQSPTPVL